MLVVGVLVAMEEFGGDPEHAQAKENAHIGWQAGHCFENRHKQQGANPQAQHQVALEWRGGRWLRLGQMRAGAGAWCLAMQAEAKDEQRQQQAYQAWHKKNESDLEYTIEDVIVYVDKKHAMYLLDKQVDFYEGPDARGFVFTDGDRKTKS